MHVRPASLAAPLRSLTVHLRAAAGLSLAKECGLKQSDLIEVIKLGAIAAPMFALKVGAGLGASVPSLHRC